MTVKELRDLLSSFDGDLPVVVFDDEWLAANPITGGRAVWVKGDAKYSCNMEESPTPGHVPALLLCDGD